MEKDIIQTLQLRHEEFKSEEYIQVLAGGSNIFDVHPENWGG